MILYPGPKSLAFIFYNLSDSSTLLIPVGNCLQVLLLVQKEKETDVYVKVEIKLYTKKN